MLITQLTEDQGGNLHTSPVSRCGTCPMGCHGRFATAQFVGTLRPIRVGVDRRGLLKASVVQFGIPLLLLGMIVVLSHTQTLSTDPLTTLVFIALTMGLVFRLVVARGQSILGLLKYEKLTP